MPPAGAVPPRGHKAPFERRTHMQSSASLKAAQTGADEPDVIVETIGEGVRRVRLNRPERLNALGFAMVQRFGQAIADASHSDARVLLVAGAGRAFCAGADLKERRTMDVEQRLAHNAAINAAINALASAPIPTVAVINGIAMGGGCEIALACDLRLASSAATIGLTESRVGAIPGAGGTQRLTRLIGAARAMQLMLTGEPVSAQRASEIGLVNEVVEPPDLDSRALELAALLASRSPLGSRHIKRLVIEGADLPLSEGLRREREALLTILASYDYAEGLAAFAEKRKPAFEGR